MIPFNVLTKSWYDMLETSNVWHFQFSLTDGDGGTIPSTISDAMFDILLAFVVSRGEKLLSSAKNVFNIQ